MVAQETEKPHYSLADIAKRWGGRSHSHVIGGKERLAFTVHGTLSPRSHDILLDALVRIVETEKTVMLNSENNAILDETEYYSHA